VDREVSRYWGTPLTWATFLFYFNRYFSILGSFPALIEWFWIADDSIKLKVSLCQLVYQLALTEERQLYVLTPGLSPTVLMSSSCPALQSYHGVFSGVSQIIVASRYLPQRLCLAALNRL
jgi:hypothetical protein